jgi:hypothetical protein
LDGCLYLVQNRKRRANNDNLVASAAAVTESGETTSTLI